MKVVTKYLGNDGVEYPDRDAALMADRRERFRAVAHRTSMGVSTPDELVEWIEAHREEVRRFVGNVGEIGRLMDG